MWRSRARALLGLGLGLGAIVMALAWPAVPAIAVAGAAQPDAGTLQVSPATFRASAPTPLTLSFTAPAIAAPAAGLDVTLSMPPSGQGTTTAAPPSGPATATVVSPTPGTAHPAIDWRPILLVVLGLVLVAGAAALAAFRPLRRGGPGTAAGNVRTLPRTGPPPSAAVRDTGDSYSERMS